MTSSDGLKMSQTGQTGEEQWQPTIPRAAGSGHDPGHDPGHDSGHDSGHDPGCDPGHDPGHGSGHDPCNDPGHESREDPGENTGSGPDPNPLGGGEGRRAAGYQNCMKANLARLTSPIIEEEDDSPG